MKKELSILLLIILLINIVFAQTNATPSAPGALTGFKDKTDAALEKEIQIPDNLQGLAKIILGIEGPIEISLLIILIWIWFVAFVMIANACKLMPFFEKGIVAWIAALIIMFLIGFSGGLNLSAQFILGIGNIFKIFKDWSAGSLIFGVILLLVVLLIISKIEKKMAKQRKIEEGKIASTELGITLGFWSRVKKGFGFGRSITPSP